MRKRLLTVLSTSVLALGLAGCGSSGGSTTADGVSLIKSGKLTVCTQVPYQPFEFQKGGEVVGFDISLMDLLAKQLKVEVAVVQSPFEGIQSGQALNTKQCDIAAAGMTITDDRAKVLTFSDPYFDATQALLVKKGGADSLAALAGKTIAVQTGTTGEIYAKKNAPKSAKIRVFEDLGLLTTAVKTGQVDAAVQDNGPLLDYVGSNPDTAVTAEFDTGEQYGFGMAKNNSTKLAAAADKMIKAAKANGQYDSLYKKWFGSAPKSS